MRGIAMAIVGATILWIYPPIHHPETSHDSLVFAIEMAWFFATLIVIAGGW